MNALQIEVDPQNTHLLLGILLLIVQDAVSYEELENGSVLNDHSVPDLHILSSGKSITQISLIYKIGKSPQFIGSIYKTLFVARVLSFLVDAFLLVIEKICKNFFFIITILCSFSKIKLVPKKVLSH